MSDIVQQLRGSVPAMPGSGLPIAWPCIVRSELLLRAAAEIERLRAEIERTHALLKDPNAVTINMLRGVIALPSADQVRHIYQQTLEVKP